MSENTKGRLLKTTGWVVIGIGLYLLTAGTVSDYDFKSRRPNDDNIIDVEFTVVEE